MLWENFKTTAILKYNTENKKEIYFYPKVNIIRWYINDTKKRCWGKASTNTYLCFTSCNYFVTNPDWVLAIVICLRSVLHSQIIPSTSTRIVCFCVIILKQNDPIVGAQMVPCVSRCFAVYLGCDDVTCRKGPCSMKGTTCYKCNSRFLNSFINTQIISLSKTEYPLLFFKVSKQRAGRGYS